MGRLLGTLLILLPQLNQYKLRNNMKNICGTAFQVKCSFKIKFTFNNKHLKWYTQITYLKSCKHFINELHHAKMALGVAET